MLNTKVKSEHEEISGRRTSPAGLDTKAQRAEGGPALGSSQGREGAGPKPRVPVPGSCLFRSPHPEKSWAKKKPRAETQGSYPSIKGRVQGRGRRFPAGRRASAGRAGSGGEGAYQRAAPRSQGRERGSKLARVRPSNITFRSRRSRPRPPGRRCSSPSRRRNRRAGCRSRAGCWRRCPSNR